MKRALYLFTILVLFYSSGHAQDSWSKAKAAGNGTLSVIYYPQAGLIYKDTDGKMKGLCVDLLNEFTNHIQTKYGKKVTVNFMKEERNFSEFLSAVQSTPNLLGVTNVTITEDRKKVMKFTPPFMTNPIVMITHKDAPVLTDLNEINTKLNGYTAEVISGSTHVKHMERIKKENMPSLRIQYNNSGSVILDNIMKNPKLFTILDFTEYMDANRRQLPVKRQNVDITKAEELAFVMHLNSDWDVLWKEFLTDEYKATVKYRKMIVDHLGAAFLTVLR